MICPGIPPGRFGLVERAEQDEAHSEQGLTQASEARRVCPCVRPGRFGLVERAEQYRWSSAAAHCGLFTDDLLSTDFPLPGIVEDWSAWLAQPDEESVIDYIRQQTQTGRPCGNETFLDQVEGLLNRTVRRKTPGRKPKKQQQKVQDDSENT